MVLQSVSDCMFAFTGPLPLVSFTAPSMERRIVPYIVLSTLYLVFMLVELPLVVLSIRRLTTTPPAPPAWFRKAWQTLPLLGWVNSPDALIYATF